MCISQYLISIGVSVHHTPSKIKLTFHCLTVINCYVKMLELQRSPNKIIPHFCLTTILLQAASCGRALRDGSDGEQEAEMSVAQGEETGEMLLSWIFTVSGCNVCIYDVCSYMLLY